jgi:hypothetical protein
MEEGDDRAAMVLVCYKCPENDLFSGIFLAAGPGPDYSAAGLSDSPCPAGFFLCEAFLFYILHVISQAMRLRNPKYERNPKKKVCAGCIRTPRTPFFGSLII